MDQLKELIAITVTWFLLLCSSARAVIPEEAVWVYYVYGLTESEDTQYYTYWATACSLYSVENPEYIRHAMNCVKMARLTEQDEWLQFVLQCAQTKLTSAFDDDFERRLELGLVPMQDGLPTNYEDFQAGLRISQRLFNEALGKK